MFKCLFYCVLVFLASVAHANTSKIQNPSDYVDIFYGTTDGGNMFPGAARPFGMVKIGVDVLSSDGSNTYSGYAINGTISGISMMHESGTGGAPEYGVVSQLPLVGFIDFSKEATLSRSAPDSGSLGYYSINATNNIYAEFAAAERSGIFKYTFPSNQTGKIMVNGSHHLASPSRPYWSQYFLNGSVEADKKLDGYTGYATIEGGWGDQGPWTIYYCGKFKNAAQSVVSFKGSSSQNSTSASSSVKNDSFGLVFEFSSSLEEVNSKVGVSFISTDQACDNIDRDFENDSYDIDQATNDAEKAWQKEVFSSIDIETDNSTLAGLVYTAMRGAHLLPSNRTGEMPKWDSDEVYYDDWFTIWDTFRCLNPLLNIINPKRSSELVQSLINIYEHDGYTPDGRSANQNGRTQGGSDSDIVMADAYVKGLKSGIDWNSAYDAMKKNADVTPPYWYDNKAPDASTKDGRGALPDWLKYGYITRNYTRSVSRTMEYAYDDFALSVVAKGLDKSDDYKKYLKRSANWQNIWNFNYTSSSFNYSGFIQPKNADGTFNYTNYDPSSCGNCYWGDDEYEGSPIEYGWAVPHDVETLISFIGDNATFIRRLDDMFGLNGKSLADIGNEPSFLTPYLYNFVNSQYKTVETVRYLVNNYFSTGPSALPGNSDAGAMQAWLLFALLGFYPVSGTTTYLLSTPFLPNISINLQNGKKVEITANNLSEDNIYVESLKVNGEDWDKNWIEHSIFSDGGSIEFTLTNSPSIWETGDAPPSPGHYTLIDIS